MSHGRQLTLFLCIVAWAVDGAALASHAQLASSQRSSRPMLPARCSVPRLDAQVRTEATVEAESADRSPRGPLFNSVRLSARKVAQWELKLFFPQRTDGDMQQQLGLRNSKDRERFYAAFLGTLFLSLGGSLALAGSNLPEAVKTSSTLILAAAPFAFGGAGLLASCAQRVASAPSELLGDGSGSPARASAARRRNGRTPHRD